MEQNNNNNPNNTQQSSSSFADHAQGHWYSHLTSPIHAVPVITTNSTSTEITNILSRITTDQEQTEEITYMDTIDISTDENNENINNNNKNNNQGDNRIQQQSIETSQHRRLSEEWLPPATSTPITTVPIDILRSQEDDENELFNNIEQIIRNFTQQPNRRYPLTRIIQWTTMNDQTMMEYVTVVVINRPSIIL